VTTCPHLEGIRAAVAAGLGVAAMPECAAPSGVATLGERHGLPSLPMCNLQLRQHDTAERHAAVEALKEVVREYRWRGYGAVV